MRGGRRTWLKLVLCPTRSRNSYNGPPRRWKTWSSLGVVNCGRKSLSKLMIVKTKCEKLPSCFLNMVGGKTSSNACRVFSSHTKTGNTNRFRNIRGRAPMELTVNQGRQARVTSEPNWMWDLTTFYWLVQLHGLTRVVCFWAFLVHRGQFARFCTWFHAVFAHRWYIDLWLCHFY